MALVCVPHRGGCCAPSGKAWKECVSEEKDREELRRPSAKQIKLKVSHGGPGRMPARYWLERLASKAENTPPENPEPVITVSPAPGFEVTVVNSSVITSLPGQEVKLPATTSTAGINDDHSTITNSEAATTEAV